MKNIKKIITMMVFAVTVTQLDAKGTFTIRKSIKMIENDTEKSSKKNEKYKAKDITITNKTPFLIDTITPGETATFSKFKDFLKIGIDSSVYIKNFEASYDITYDVDSSSLIATQIADDGKTYNNLTGYPIEFEYKRKNHSRSHSVSKNVDESYTLNDNNDKMKRVVISLDIEKCKLNTKKGHYNITYKDGALFVSPVMYASINPVTLIPQIIEETGHREDSKTSEENVNSQRCGRGQRSGYQDGYEDGFADGLSEANYSDDDGPVYNAPRRAVNADDDSSGRNYQDGYEDGHADGLNEANYSDKVKDLTITNKTPFLIDYINFAKINRKTHWIAPEETVSFSKFKGLVYAETDNGLYEFDDAASQTFNNLEVVIKDSGALEASYDVTYDADSNSVIATQIADDGKTYNNLTGYPIEFEYKRKNHSNGHSVSKAVDETYTAKDKLKYMKISLDIKKSKFKAENGDYNITYKDGALFVSPVIYASINPVTLIPQIIEEIDSEL